MLEQRCVDRYANYIYSISCDTTRKDTWPLRELLSSKVYGYILRDIDTYVNLLLCKTYAINRGRLILGAQLLAIIADIRLVFGQCAGKVVSTIIARYKIQVITKGGINHCIKGSKVKISHRPRR